MPIRIGAHIHPQHADFDAMRTAWQEADELGADTIYIWDHFYPLYGEPDGKHFEGGTLLAALAASTRRARIGCLVFCNSYRNPQLLADMHRTIDHISGGRAILGIGAGWFERDYDEYGYTFGTAPDRLRALARDLPLIKDRIAKLNPPPAGPLPILIGGAGEKVTLKLVAQYADMWHAFGDVETYRQKSEILAAHCAKIGRDPNTIERVWGNNAGWKSLANDETVAAGIHEITVGIGGNGHGYDLKELHEAIAWRDSVNS